MITAPLPQDSASRFRRFVRRFAKSRKGATAVEFGMLALPFFLLLGGILELGLVFMASITLDNATLTASRKIRTGETTSSGSSANKELQRQAFRDEICNNMNWMVSDCIANLSIDVRTFTAFNDINLTDPVQNGVFDPGVLQFETGSANSIILVRVYYPWKLFMPVLNKALVRTEDKTLLTSVATFRTEPYAL